MKNNELDIMTLISLGGKVFSEPKQGDPTKMVDYVEVLTDGGYQKIYLAEYDINKTTAQ